MRRLVVAVLILWVVALVLVGVYWSDVLRFYYAWTGAHDETGVAYGFWSGYGGAFLAPNLSIFTVGFALYRHHTCHSERCWRVGKHRTPAGYLLCKRCIAKPAGELGLHPIHEDHR